MPEIGFLNLGPGSLRLIDQKPSFNAALYPRNDEVLIVQERADFLDSLEVAIARALASSTG